MLANVTRMLRECCNILVQVFDLIKNHKQRNVANVVWNVRECYQPDNLT